MASCSAVVVVVLLGLLAGAAAVTGGAAAVPGGGCEVSALAAEVAASCAAGTAAPPCCEPVLASVELGGGACLCRLASETSVLHAGLNGSALVALYASCRGGGSSPSLAACDGAPPSVGTVVPALRSAATGVHFADVVKADRVGATPEESSSVSSLGDPRSPPPVVDAVQATHSLASGDRKLILLFAASQVIGLILTVVIATIEVCRCINGRRKA